MVFNLIMIVLGPQVRRVRQEWQVRTYCDCRACRTYSPLRRAELAALAAPAALVRPCRPCRTRRTRPATAALAALGAQARSTSNLAWLVNMSLAIRYPSIMTPSTGAINRWATRRPAKWR